jgi:hypothetical protein
MPMPEYSFLNKPQHLAHIGGKKILSGNKFVMEDPFVLLSIHPSQLDDSPYDYTVRYT